VRLVIRGGMGDGVEFSRRRPADFKNPVGFHPNEVNFCPISSGHFWKLFQRHLTVDFRIIFCWRVTKCMVSYFYIIKLEILFEDVTPVFLGRMRNLKKSLRYERVLLFRY
jgi:hypothetical protein